MDRVPQDFIVRMKKLLDEEAFEQFLACYANEPRQALRINTLKISVEDFFQLSPFSLQPVPWAKTGFYYEKTDRPGKHPYHEAGLYYIQEPSAMAVAELADAKPGDRVLDLCAAPGGKTTQLAAAMKGEGLLVSNEIHPARAKILAQNVERMGISNALVTNETPKNLAKRFPLFFDRVIVDAPCSGEGMFRKEEQALLQWSQENVDLCAKRQQEILKEAVKMLKPGGRLVYSTCTFAPEENEGAISCFLEEHPDFVVEKVNAYERFDQGHPEWVSGPNEIENTFRLWPHQLEGEGHYVAVLRRIKENSSIRDEGYEKKKKGKNSISRTEKASQTMVEAMKGYEIFAKETLKSKPEGVPVLFGEQLYLLPENIPLQGLKALRAGLHAGTVHNGRFIPSHTLALFLNETDVIRCCNLKSDGEQIKGYLRGEAFSWEGETGWYLVLVDGYSIGWGKANSGLLKNHYPKGLRWNN